MLPRKCISGLHLALALIAASSAHAGFGFFSQTWGDVIASTDTTEAGRALVPPTPAQPVYYRGLSLGCKLGSIPGDLPPDVERMNRFVARILAKQGYLAATPGHEPTLLLVVQWGYLRPRGSDLIWFLGYNASQDIAAPAFPGQLGPEVWRRNLRSHTIETILGNADDPNYGVIVTAFKFHPANTPDPLIYWQTRISLPANGKSMTEALPAMLAAADSAIGRPSNSPLLRDADEAREGRVELGPAEVLGYEEPSRAGKASQTKP